MSIPKVLLAATKSGCGKTLITCALLEAVKNRGMKVKSFKCGPDYIDPMFHKKVIGVASKNLDLYFTEPKETAYLFEKGNDSDISVIEGVMGLYDGVGGVTSQASAYDLAKTLQAPVILIVDGKGMGYSMLAEIKGFQALDQAKCIKGVILNRVSKGSFDLFAPLIERECDIEILGYYPMQKDISLESRHLGLKMPEEVASLREMVEKAARALEESVDIDRILELAKESAQIRPQEKGQDGPAGEEEILKLKENFLDLPEERRPRVAIAMDEAFCFYYQDNLDLLTEAGVRLVPFSPIHDEKLPDNIKGLILGGGYPELYAKELSANESMKKSIKSKLPDLVSIAECGGFLYLHQWMKAEDGKNYSMVGALDGSCENKKRLVRFGYADLREKNGYFLPKEESIHVHEFHYYDSSINGSDCRLVKPVSGRSWEACHVGKNFFWGFPHLYFPANIHFLESFLKKLK